MWNSDLCNQWSVGLPPPSQQDFMDETARKIVAAKEMREQAKRLQLVATEQGMQDIVSQYENIIRQWDELLTPFD